MTTWGLSATIKAPTPDILRFAAYHLEQGAHRLYLYLDDPESDAFNALKLHPEIRPTRCDDGWWNGKRPKRHQVRQSQNATHAYGRANDIDWLIHMDVDEFLVWDGVSGRVSDKLSDLPTEQMTARIRPMEQLAGEGKHFKAFIPPGPDRTRIVADLYPTYGNFLKGGFLSHLAGKVFVRTGLPSIRVQIHNVFQEGEMLKGPDDTPGITLAHCHAPSWEAWLSAYRFRMEQGSYRPDLGPNRPREQGGMSMHELFRAIEAEGGETALRAFFDEVCADSPGLRGRLARHGLLRHADLDLNTTMKKHFPQGGG
ncbi:glycosyltransferase family 2 protein [Marimonas sp. MJW-29]|uniref:Glycosyltransferase family 2 protein n=1 Tax=Sulfitobacter sediminis TaxID=3234186 RepID=A0ABV3RUA2_9RHOB